jgi:hypothetical protein
MTAPITPLRSWRPDTAERAPALLGLAGPSIVTRVDSPWALPDTPTCEPAHSEPDRPFTAIPSDDEAFRHAIAKAIRAAPTREALRAAIKCVYPHVRIVVQDPFGAIPGAPLKLYVYLDGWPGQIIVEPQTWSPDRQPMARAGTTA